MWRARRNGGERDRKPEHGEQNRRGARCLLEITHGLLWQTAGADRDGHGAHLQAGGIGDERRHLDANCFGHDTSEEARDPGFAAIAGIDDEIDEAAEGELVGDDEGAWPEFDGAQARGALCVDAGSGAKGLEGEGSGVVELVDHETDALAVGSGDDEVLGDAGESAGGFFERVARNKSHVICFALEEEGNVALEVAALEGDGHERGDLVFEDAVCADHGGGCPRGGRWSARGL
ncbi:MAG: hypothetical protein U0Q16_17245 [Bryobacteraceae bacterium]